jgi:hypothetical protein
MIPPDPVLDPADTDAAFARLLALIPGYVPGLLPADGGAALSILRVVAQLRTVVNQRLNAIPNKNLLAFLDFLGQSLIEPRAARAPVVFSFQPPTTPGLPQVLQTMLAAQKIAIPVPTTPPPAPVRVPAGTAVAANPPGGGLPLIFQTEHPIGLTPGILKQVVSLWPGRDTYFDHSALVAARNATTIFAEDTAQPTPHILCLGHAGYLALKGTVTVEVEINLISPGSQPLTLIWETWDGQGWRAFGDPDVYTDPSDTSMPPATTDGTNGLTRSGVVRLSGDCVDNESTAVNAIAGYWLRVRLTDPLPPELTRADARIGRVRLNPLIQRLFDPSGLDTIKPADIFTLLLDQPKLGVLIDAAFGSGQSLDLTKPFSPFGPTPQPGSDFVVACEEVLSKPGASVRLAIVINDLPALTDASSIEVDWEWFDGQVWNDLGAFGVGNTPTDFTGSMVVGFTVPATGIPSTMLRGQTGRWVRAVLKAGAYVVASTITVPSPTQGQPPLTISIEQPSPPVARTARLAYVYTPPRDFPQHCLTYNDFAYEDHTEDARLAGPGFVAFSSVADATAALYLGFDRPFPSDLVSLYWNIQEGDRVPGPTLTWEYWDGASWSELGVQDETAQLVQPGMIDFVGPADAAALARFGTPLYWVRGRLREDGDPLPATILSIDPNAVWASQTQTISNEILGSGNGQPSQSFFAARPPVLGGEIVQVRELEGARAAVELPILARQVNPADLNIVTDSQGRVREVWVRWQSRPNFDLSGPDDRHYVIERTRGRILSGDRIHGRTITPGRDNVALRQYQTGGGAAGNVGAGTITQLLGSLPFVNGVTNPVAAEGGADGEGLDGIRVRGPEVLRHRERALAARDYEELAREASPAVAVARAVPATGPDGLPAAGWVKLVIMPRSQDPRPQPSLGLRPEIHDYIMARATADLAGLDVVGPDYWPVGVNATVTPVQLDQAGPVAVAARQALEAFLHPLTGGPDGQGWPPGRSVYLSDVAVAVAATRGLDYASELELTLNGIPQGDQVDVPLDRIVVAGPVLVKVRSPGRTC